MTNTQPEYFEDKYPEAIENVYNQEGIDNMINTMNSLNLDKNSEQYKSFVLSIQEAIQVFESKSGKKYKHKNNSLKDELEESDLIEQMQKFYAEKNNIVSINDGSEYQPETKKTRRGIKKIVSKVLNNLKKIS